MAITYHAGRRVQGTATDFNSGTITRIGSLSHAETAVTGSTTWTYTHTNASGSNRIMLVSIGTETGGDTVSGIDYGGQALVKIANALDGTGVNNVSMWYLLESGIASASNTTITITQPSNTTKTTSGAISYEGVDQTTPVSEYATDITAVATHTGLALTEAVGNLLVVITGNGSARYPTYPATMTEQYDSADYTYVGTSLTLADRLSITDGSIDPAPTMSGVTRNTGISVEFTAYASNNIVNAQLGSRFEETDTRKMYHFEEGQDTEENIFNSAFTTSGNASQTTATDPTGKVVMTQSGGSGNQAKAYRTLSSISSSNKNFTIDFTFKRNSGDLGNNSLVMFGSDDSTASPSGSNKRLYFGFENASQISVKCETASDSSNGITDTTYQAASTTKYYRFVGNGSTIVLTMYSTLLDRTNGTSADRTYQSISFPSDWTTTDPIDTLTLYGYSGYHNGNWEVSDVEMSFNSANAWKEEGT